MRAARRAALIVMFVALTALSAPTASAAPSTGWQARMLTEVNATRVQAGVAPLRLCRTLGQAAAKYAAVMAASDTFGHVGLDGSLPWDRVRAEGYTYRAVGENLGGRFPTVATVMNGWRVLLRLYCTPANYHEACRLVREYAPPSAVAGGEA